MLPRLVYIGDVPVTRTEAGALQLFRLLQTHPPQHLTVVESNVHDSPVALRLQNVTYRQLWVAPRRALQTRWTKQINYLAMAWLHYRPLRELREIRTFHPEAMLTVAHGFAWQLAARIAHELSIPLHVIMHDHWPTTAPVPARVAPTAEAWFAQCYHQATSRLCISPYMANYYESRYRGKAIVLYPSRPPGCVTYDGPPSRTRDRRRRPVVAYGGSITPGYVEPLQMCVRALQRSGGYLHIYGRHTLDGLRRLGIQGDNVVARGFAASDEFVASLRADADILLVPMSFDAPDRENMEIGLPSKLADYTAAALPMLALAPRYSSVAQWALANPGVAILVDSLDESLVAQSIVALAENPPLRLSLAHHSLDYGGVFSHTEVGRTFRETISANAYTGAIPPDWDH